MELILDKLGRIEHAEIDVRPLTVFVGENNTNKTWAAYCLYGLARHLSWSWSTPIGHDFGQGALPIDAELADQIEGAARRLLATTPDDIDVYGISTQRRDLIDDPRSPITFVGDSELIRRVLRLTDEIAADSRVSLRVPPGEFAAGGWEAQIKRSRSQRLVTTQFLGPNKIESFAWRMRVGESDQGMDEHMLELLRAFAYRFLGPGTILALPSERKALATTYNMLGRGFEEVLPRPVFEFVEFLKTCENVALAREEVGFLEAVHHLETSILDGSIRFHSVPAGVRLAYFPRIGGALPMHAASSLVRALAGLDVYLRYWAQPGDLLIIDEPEMNAHPAAQLRIVELLATLVNKGVRIVLTTHSPYVLDHLGTLVEASRLQGDARARIVQKLRLGTGEALLEPEKLAVYRFDLDGKVTPIFDRETRSIDPSTFSDVGDAETNLFSEVLAEERGRGD